MAMMTRWWSGVAKEKYSRVELYHWLIMGRSRNWPDLRSPIYKKSEIYKLYVFGSIPNPESFKYFFQLLWPWRDCKVFQRWGSLTWPGDLTLGDLDLKFSGKLRYSCRTAMQKMVSQGCVFNPPVGGGLNKRCMVRDRIGNVVEY